MAEFHRKIELQSPDDLQYLISNVRRAAHEKIDRDLPPIEGEDRMRRRVEDLVQEVCFPHPSPSANLSHCCMIFCPHSYLHIVVYITSLPHHLTKHHDKRVIPESRYDQIHAHDVKCYAQHRAA
jgi:kinetochor protein Mis14/NSL1